MSPSSSAKKSRSHQGDPGGADDKAVGPGEPNVAGDPVGLIPEDVEKPRKKKRKSRKSRLGKPCKGDNPLKAEEVQDLEAPEEVQDLEAPEVVMPPTPMETEPATEPETDEEKKKKEEEKAKFEKAAKDLVFMNQ